MKKVKIRLLQSIGGHRPNGALFSFAPGTELEWPADEAQRFIDAGYALKVEEKAPANR